jgi:signal transduction histidine kinase/CheY-like chemotaxis protein
MNSSLLYIISSLFKKTSLLIFLFTVPFTVSAQSKIDSLKSILYITKEDTVKADLYEKLGQAYRDEKKIDSSISAYKQALELNEKNSHALSRQCADLATIDYLLYETGNYSASLKYALKELAITEKMNDKVHAGFVHLVFGHNYRALGYYRESLNHYFKAQQIFKSYYLLRHEADDNTYTIQCIGYTYLKMKRLDSALIFTQQAYKLAQAKPAYGLILYSWRIFGDIYLARGDDETALNYYRRYISNFVKYKEKNDDLSFVLINTARIFKNRGQIDSAIFYAKKGLANAQKYTDQENLFSAGKLLADYFDDKNDHEALRYLKIATLAKDSMLSIDKLRQAQILSFNQQIREKEQAAAEAKEAARTRLLIIIGAIVISIISFLIWNRIRQLRLRHKMILEQKELEKLKAIDRMKEKFFSNITHELRTPLSLIMSPAQFYLEHPDELKDTGKLLGSIFKNSGYLLNLINQLLDISKLDAGKMTITLAKGDFGNYIGDFIKTFEEQAAKKQVGLHFENQLEGEYLFDQEHWKKIINNLVGNALKFTHAKGDVFINVSKTASSAQSSTVRFMVKDTGIGIDENELPFIADRFYQADNKLSRKYEGTGIGLALVNELVGLMDAKLTVTSEKGKGSIFTITAQLFYAEGKECYPEVFPLEKTNLHSDNDVNHSYTSGLQVPGVPVILVAEDNKELRDFLKDSIEPLYKVITAADGREGFEIALSQIPDMIISDVMMPVMDGFEFCNKIKKEPATSHIPFIILSAKTTFESKINGLQMGADDYLTKPFNVDEIRAKIKNTMHGREMLRKHYLEQLTGENPLTPLSGLQDEFLKRTFKIIEEHIDDSQLSVELLAAKMDLNHTVIDRKFSFFLGLSANELIRQFRLKREKMEHNLLDMEAKTLRAQMNPHFIFNCMNSIKSLIQSDEGNKAVTYLTTFSKLLRTILQNSDEREVTLYDELETCKLYVQLEALRFGNKFNYQFNIDESTDLKSIKVPALIIQPFIENAIWHGIMPKENGGTVSVSVVRDGNAVRCIIEDNGIGRERSKQNEFKTGQAPHQSKGICLTQGRLHLDSLLNSRNSGAEIIDKYDQSAKPAGTKIVLTFSES